MAFPLIAFAAVGAIAGVIGGFQKKRALENEADAIRQEGEIIYQESLRDAAIVRKEGDVFAQTQSLQYIASGFVLGGSALITMKDTRIKAGAQAQSIAERGAAISTKANRQALRLDTAGRGAVIEGLIKGATSIFKATSGTVS